MSFAEIGLLPELLKAVSEAGYTEPTPIQSQAIPVILAGRDVMGGAQTGTGKTAGFTLPLLQRIARHANTSPSPARHPVRALVLCPTRELAMQVHESVRTYAKYLAIKSTVIYGGVDIKPQKEELRQGREVVVATPGRLLDHLEGKTINLSQVEVLVLDEADRMLDMGFIPDIRRILGLLPKDRQSLLFSATFSEEIKRLADSMLRQPQLIEVARRNTVSDTITHVVHPVAQDDKRALLAHLIQSKDLRQALVFVGTKFGCSRLAHYLERQGIQATAIHGDKSQQQRTEALEAFKTGAVKVLVATDVAARGLDIDDLPHVINYELPHTPEDYIHRIGRTGRAGRMGDAISLVCNEERFRLTDIEKLIKRSINQEVVTGFTPESGRSDSESGRGGRGRNTGRRAPEANESRPAHGRPERAPERARTSAPPRAKPPALAADGFDWRKPYEPANPPEQSSADTARPARAGRVSRPVAALLGGGPKKS